MKISKWIFALGYMIVFISCKKNIDGMGVSEPPDLSGKWVFTVLENNTTATDEYLENGHIITDVTFYSYTSGPTMGTVTISGDSIVGTGLGYQYNMFERITEYTDNVFSNADSIVIPLVDTAANSLIKFEFIGKDSIHYIYGTLTGSNGSGTSLTTGAKISLNGDILTLSSDIYFQDSQTDSGLTGLSGNVVTTLKRY
jgi:hypothetical protein